MALSSGTNNLHSGAHPFLTEIICLAQDTDLESNTFICKTLVTLKSTKLTKLMRSLDGLSHCLAFAERLLTVDGTAAIISSLVQAVNTLLTFMPPKYPQNLMVIMKGHMATLLNVRLLTLPDILFRPPVNDRSQHGMLGVAAVQV